MRYQIICIIRRDKRDDPHRHISHLGVGGPGGWSRVLMVEEVMAQMQRSEGDRYYLRGRDGWEAEVKLGRCPFCAEGHAFILSAPDLTAKDKLISLPMCAQ